MILETWYARFQPKAKRGVGITSSISVAPPSLLICHGYIQGTSSSGYIDYVNATCRYPKLVGLANDDAMQNQGPKAAVEPIPYP